MGPKHYNTAGLTYLFILFFSASQTWGNDSFVLNPGRWGQRKKGSCSVDLHVVCLYFVFLLPQSKFEKAGIHFKSDVFAAVAVSNRQQKRQFWNEFPSSQSLSRLFQFAENGNCSWISLELISWGPHSSLEREKEIRRRLFTSSIKLAIRHFHVVVVQGRWRNVQKSVKHVQSCCFA